MTTAILLHDAEAALRRTAQAGEFSTLEAAFLAWLRGEPAPPGVETALAPPLRSYDDIAVAAIAEAAGWAINGSQLDDGLHWLVEVALERVVGIPAPVVTDGLAHVALGLAARERTWFGEWHDRVIDVAAASVTPAWLVGGAALVRGRSVSCAPELRLALAARGSVTNTDSDAASLLERLLLGQLPEDPFHAQVMLAALHWVRRAAPIVIPGQAKPTQVANLLHGVPAGSAAPGRAGARASSADPSAAIDATVRTPPADNGPRTFVSYRHADQAVVGALVGALRSRGVVVDVDLDEEAPPYGWATWVEAKYRNATHVLAACSPAYREAFDAPLAGPVPVGASGRGVMREAHMMRDEILEGDLQRMVPVVLPGATAEAISKTFGSATRYCLPEDLERLARRLRSAPGGGEPERREPEGGSPLRGK